MTWLGTTYLVLSALALAGAIVHAFQAALLRRDTTPLTISFACFGFALYTFGVAVSRGLLAGGNHPLAAVLGIGLGMTMAFVFVPMTAWTLLELPFTPARLAYVGVVGAIGLARTADLAVNGTVAAAGSVLSWPVGLAAVSLSVVWTIESARSIRRMTPYARTMTAFGVVAAIVAIPGFMVSVGIIFGPDIFGLATLPFVGFVNTLTTLRYVYTLRNPNQPAGDMSRYQVFEQLGSGGMGDVFLARRRGPAGFVRDVVLKTLREWDADAESRGRFLAEARLAAQLRHPNIVDVYDLGEQPGGFFIVMERIDGPTLLQVLQQAYGLSQKVPAEIVAELGVQLCRALDFAHAAGVIHRDLKPANVMLSRAGVAKLIDFGIAQQAAAAPEQDGVIGTHGYISPERMFGEAASAASDLFGLGVVLFQALTLEVPFPQRTSDAMVAAVQAYARGTLLQKRSDCPPALAEAVEQCLAFSSSERPRSAAALAAQLETGLLGARVDLAAFVAKLFPVEGAVAVPQPVERHAVTTAPAKARS